MTMAFSRFGSRWFSGPRHRPAGSGQQQRHRVGGVALRAHLLAAGAPAPSSEAGWAAAMVGPAIPEASIHKTLILWGIRAVLDWTRALHRAHRRTWHRCHGNCGQNRRCVDLRFSSGSYMQQAAIKLSTIKIHRRRRNFGGRYILYNYDAYVHNFKRPTASH